MSYNSSIEWTETTWNPLAGCLAVSPGCDHCYAARDASRRLSGTPTYAGLAQHGVFNGTVRLLPERLDQPLHWSRPRLVFVNSMSDLFHADVPAEYIREVFNTMRNCDGGATAATGKRRPSHTFQVLTKRAERMERLATTRQLGYDPARPPENVWLGVSVETDTYYSRIRHLQRTPAAVRFLSCEPLLGPLRNLPLDGIDWVIVGGESGSGARPMHPHWVREIREQCAAAGVAFLFKQWGEWVPSEQLSGREDLGCGTPESTGVERDPTHPDDLTVWRMARVGKGRAGRILDGRTYNAMPGGSPRRRRTCA